jgi:peptidoglycan/LPS O-acetylase OafA/YrhL
MRKWLLTGVFGLVATVGFSMLVCANYFGLDNRGVFHGWWGFVFFIGFAILTFGGMMLAVELFIGKPWESE